MLVFFWIIKKKAWLSAIFMALTGNFFNGDFYDNKGNPGKEKPCPFV